jgi:hypothetical protein
VKIPQLHASSSTRCSHASTRCGHRVAASITTDPALGRCSQYFFVVELLVGTWYSQ